MAQGSAVSSSVPDQNEPPPADAELPSDEGADAAADAEVAIEARARDMGWKPLAEYRGPPGKWQPAADFISRGENILPIVRDQNRRLTERIGKLVKGRDGRTYRIMDYGSIGATYEADPEQKTGDK